MTDRVNTDVVSAAMCGASCEFDLRPDETAMSSADREASGLGENRVFRADSALHEGAHPDALVFLIVDGRDDDLPLRASSDLAKRSSSSHAHRGDSRFHVGGSPSV